MLSFAQGHTAGEARGCQAFPSHRCVSAGPGLPSTLSGRWPTAWGCLVGNRSCPARGLRKGAAGKWRGWRVALGLTALCANGGWVRNSDNQKPY